MGYDRIWKDFYCFMFLRHESKLCIFTAVKNITMQNKKGRHGFVQN